MTEDPIRLAFSPDGDDAFMFWALLRGKVDAEGLEFVAEQRDTESLNALADREEVDVLAVSMARYASIADRYLLLPHGASVGRGYGPVVVAPRALSLADLAGKRVAVPGLRTTAYLVLRMLLQRFEPVVVPIAPHDLVFQALRSGNVDAALLIHEGRLTFEREGFTLVADIGVEWSRMTGLPLPLGVNVIRRALGPERIARISRVCRRSIVWAMEHKGDVMTELLAHPGPLDREALDRYLAMYANADTEAMAEDVVRAMDELFERGAKLGLVAKRPTIELAP
jgi:1,4-dihydroxy-6-naphthoate synthase